jgi:NADH-quinone oxidoreductase subunit M
MLGPVDKEENKTVPDLNKREIISIIPILIMIVWIGVHPNTFLHKSEASVKKVIEFIDLSKKSVLGIH